MFFLWLESCFRREATHSCSFYVLLVTLPLFTVKKATPVCVCIVEYLEKRVLKFTRLDVPVAGDPACRINWWKSNYLLYILTAEWIFESVQSGFLKACIKPPMFLGSNRMVQNVLRLGKSTVFCPKTKAKTQL